MENITFFNEKYHLYSRPDESTNSLSLEEYGHTSWYIYIVKPSIQPFHFTPNCTEVIIIPVKNSAPSMVKCWALEDQYAVNKYL